MNLKTLNKSLARKDILLPVLQLFHAQEQREVAEGRRSRKAGVIDDAKLSIKAFTDRVSEFNHGEDPKGEFYHPSALGKCMRQVWFDYFRVPGVDRGRDDVLRDQLRFEIGTYFHVLFQNLCERAGVLESREVTIQDAKNKILGHADGILCIDEIRYVLEIKTINSRDFTGLIQGPKFDHTKQAFAYMKSLNISRCLVVYFNKDTAQCKEFLLRMDSAFYEKEVANRVHGHFKNIRLKKLPAREGSGPTDPICRYCPHTGICFVPAQLKKTLDPLPQLKGYTI